MASTFADHWNLDPDTTYLNHGSFGPSPVEVRHARQLSSARLESQPMRFFCQQMEEELDNAAAALAGMVGTSPQRLALVDNATVAMNIAAASVPLNAGDEVLITDHEYGAVRKIWQQRCRETGATIVPLSIPLPVDEDKLIIEFENACTERTRVVVISHVTSPTALIFPVQRICSAAKRKGIVSVVDGPHAVAMLDLNLDALNCDFYCASCHKWLCAPFGSGFLWAHPRHHTQIHCPMVSWGGSLSGRAATWQDRTNWLGTRDPAPLLSIPVAIDFFEKLGGFHVFRDHAHQLVSYGLERLLDMEGVQDFSPPGPAGFVSMKAVELPQPEGWQAGYHGQIDPLQQELRDEHRIEVPVTSWSGRRLLRISCHLYNTSSDIDRLCDALNRARSLR